MITKAQRNTEIKVLVPFSSRSGCPGTAAAASLDSPDLFSCLEEDCVKMCSTYEDLQHHLDTECHIFMEEQDTAYDIIKKKWASILSSVSLPKQGSLSQMKTSCESVVRNQPTFEGWALKTVQKSTRMSENVTTYLIKKFNDGAQKGNKADAKQVEHEMKHAQSSTGGLLFQPHKWRTSKQIASFFYTLSKSQRAKSVEGGTETFDSEDEEPINQDKPLQAMQLIVETQVKADHPIFFQEHNFCQLTEQGNLGKLQLDVLKKACSEFQVEIIGAKTKRIRLLPLYTDTSYPTVKRAVNSVTV